jgi:hypothetical protein
VKLWYAGAVKDREQQRVDAKKESAVMALSFESIVNLDFRATLAKLTELSYLEAAPTGAFTGVSQL